MTAFYSWRLMIMTFHGQPRADHHTMEHVHESPWIMLVPLMPLAHRRDFRRLVCVRLVRRRRPRGVLGSCDVCAAGGHDSDCALPSIFPNLKNGCRSASLLPGIFFAYVFYMLKPQWPGKVARGARRPLSPRLSQILFR